MILSPCKVQFYDSYILDFMQILNTVIKFVKSSQQKFCQNLKFKSKFSPRDFRQFLGPHPTNSFAMYTAQLLIFKFSQLHRIGALISCTYTATINTNYLLLPCRANNTRFNIIHVVSLLNDQNRI